MESKGEIYEAVGNQYNELENKLGAEHHKQMSSIVEFLFTIELSKYFDLVHVRQSVYILFVYKFMNEETISRSSILLSFSWRHINNKQELSNIYLSMEIPAPKKGIHVCLYHFINKQWTEFITGDLLVDTDDKKFTIKFRTPIDWSLWPDKQALYSQQQQSQLQFKFSDIKEAEEDEKDRKVAYFWFNKQPLAISFLEEAKCKFFLQIILSQLEVVEENVENNDQVDLSCVRDMINESHSIVSSIFITGNIPMIKGVFQVIQQSLDDLAEQEKIFSIIKIAIRVSDIKILSMLLEGKNYEIMLKGLKSNPFNDRNFDYWQQYQALAQFHNVLDFQDPEFHNCYEIICRAKFLKDCAACMFTQLETQRNLNNIITNNNQIILQKLANSQQCYKQLSLLSISSPEPFLKTVSEIWEIFQSVCTDVETIVSKDRIWHNFIKFQLHQSILQAASKLSILQRTQLVPPRFHEKWINAFSTFLNYDWNQIQPWILQAHGETSFSKLFFDLFMSTTDESLMETIMNFIRQITIPNQTKLKVSERLAAEFFNNFFVKIWIKMQKQAFLIDQYLSQILKLYKVNPIRTRRVLIQCKILPFLDKNVRRSKTITICAVKLLETFLSEENRDIFRYLQIHNIFKDALREQYFRNRWSDNIINGCFRALKEKVEQYKYREELEYFSDIFTLQKQTDFQENQ